MTAHPLTSSALLILAVTTSACTGAGQRLTPYSNPSISSVNQPVVQRADYIIDLAGSGNGVPDGELDRLDAWFGSLKLGYGDKVWVDPGSSYSDPQTRRDIAGVAGSYGLLISEGVPVTAGPVATGGVRVIVGRSFASVPGCPLWNASSLGSRTSTSPNYGCATNSNLAAMIADPNDLVLGQSIGDTRALDDGAKAIKAYRGRIQTGFEGGLKKETQGTK